MDRLTTNKPVSKMSMVELAYNGCFAKDGEAYYRDFEEEKSARELARTLLKKYADGDDAFTDDDNFDDEIMELLQYGTRTIEGLIALFYRNLWAMADLRETLKQYEDLGTVEELKALKDKPKCDECAGCTAWKCDCSNIRNKAIDDFVELALEQFTEFDVKHGYPTVADCKVILRDIAEQMKHE